MEKSYSRKEVLEIIEDLEFNVTAEFMKKHGLKEGLEKGKWYLRGELDYVYTSSSDRCDVYNIETGKCLKDQHQDESLQSYKGVGEDVIDKWLVSIATRNYPIGTVYDDGCEDMLVTGKTFTVTGSGEDKLITVPAISVFDSACVNYDVRIETSAVYYKQKWAKK